MCCIFTWSPVQQGYANHASPSDVTKYSQSTRGSNFGQHPKMHLFPMLPVRGPAGEVHIDQKEGFMTSGQANWAIPRDDELARQRCGEAGNNAVRVAEL